ncbi:MAG TPA: M15 family metallopeptidase [Gammaproteobacteria bacterium]|nr:M15 family metallopeptidase [Gammaproteobacteria bacterium]
MKRIIYFLIPLVTLAMPLFAASPNLLHHLSQAYPDSVKKVTENYIELKDGTRIPISGSLPVFDFFVGKLLRVDYSYGSISRKELKRDRCEAFFRKIYGNSAREVEKNLVTIYWMPNVFGKRYPLKVTKINGVDKKLQQTAAELERLPSQYYKYLAKPASGYHWRNVAGERYLSLHSFGIAIDINLDYSNYWLWDFLKLKRPISDLPHHKIQYQNKIPIEIVKIFAKHGFYWGGNWYFYDTMHFEYRPELLKLTA